MRACRGRFLLFFLCLINMVFVAAPAMAQAVLASSTARHEFSDAFKSDYFKLTLKGANLVEADATLEILDPNGKQIYTEDFTADMLLKPETGDSELGIKEKEAYIRKRVEEFFKEDNFYKPAIDIKDAFDMDANPDLKEWEVLRGDRTAIGFGYYFNFQSKRKIAWSKKWKKIVVYWQSQ